MNKIKIKDWVLQLALALIIFFGFLRPYVIEAFRIPTPSMEKTMLVGDHLLVLKVEEGQQIPWTDHMRPLIYAFRGDEFNLHMPATGDPEVGEILVFRYPVGPGKDFVKRLVALAGDTVRVEEGVLYVNGSPSENWSSCYQDAFEPSPLDEAWPDCLDQLYGRVADLAYWEIRQGCINTEYGLAYVVPENYVFMMGDNRDHSSDSRVWGPLHEDLIKGEALVTYWSWVPGHGLPKFDRIARLIR